MSGDRTASKAPVRPDPAEATARRRRRLPPAARWALLAVVAFAPLAEGRPPPATGAPPGPARHETEFLIELPRFVEWPEALFPAPDAPFCVGVLGDEELRDALARALEGRHVDGRPFRVRGFRNLDEVEPCPILYVGREKARLMPVIVEFLDGATVLTVSDREDFLARGGILRLLEGPGHVDFEVDVGAAARVEIRFSSRLLKLAERVVAAPAASGAP